jgi:hypothetical protein
MFENENDILGFDPQDLSVFNEKDNKSKSQGNPNIYHTRPAESKSEDGRYRCTIKVVYNPFNLKESVLEQQSYAIHDSEGWLTLVSTLTNGDTSCPIFKAWKKCHFAKKEENFNLWRQAAAEKDGGRDLFDKRFARYAVIQVLEDKNHPENVNKFMLWKLPKVIYDLINAKQKPSKESGKAAIPVMDFLFGRSIDIEVVPGEGDPGSERYNRDTKYIAELSEDTVCCVNPDGSPLLNDSEQAVLNKYVTAMKEIWKEKDPKVRAEKKKLVDADPNTLELGKIYNGKVIPAIKAVCPNLLEELGYKPWTPEQTARVQRWIDIVLAGNDPSQESNAPEVAATVGTEVGESTEKTSTVDDPIPSGGVSDDAGEDLPF